MKIGILAAMDEELGLVKEAIRERKEEKALRSSFYTGSWHGQSVILARSGVGKVNAAAVSQRLISHYQPEVVVMVGVAGASHRDLSIGDVVVVSEAVHWDLDATGLGFELGEIPFLRVKIMKADQQLVLLAHRATERARLEAVGAKQPRVFVGRIASGDTFITEEAKIKIIVKRFNNLCVDMESAAVAQVCVLNEVPFAMIKSVSDKADSEARVDFADFLEIAASNSFLVLDQFLKELSAANRQLNSL